MPIETFRPLVEATRGPLVESVHFGAFAVVDAAGRLLAAQGDPQFRTYLRSSAKPLQALALIEGGGAEAFGLEEPEVALLCASHTGTDRHVATAAGMQAKIGIHESDLQCGVHPPSDEGTRYAMRRRGEAPTPNRHNCSGKHTGMLALARLRGDPIQDYLDPQHPVQQTILRTFAEMCALAPEEIVLGTDGCSAPVFAIPLYNAALGYARLCDPAGLPEKRAAACRRITHAMAAYPEMIAGPQRFDTGLMAACGGRVVCKQGAEGFLSLGILPGAVAAGSPGMGVAIKIADGDLHGQTRPQVDDPNETGDAGGRARPIVALEILRRLGVLDAAQARELAHFDARPLSNWRGLRVGEIRPAFDWGQASSQSQPA
ncbi:MAG: asparaginase [Chloroflexi bacterium]|nr:asparaginase [Chloroflexota bacterium]